MDSTLLTVWIVLYCGIARFALLLHAKLSFIYLQEKVRKITISSIIISF